MPIPDYEKLGVFYLGREYDPAARVRKPDLLLYDSKDLVTHAVCVGMTGSGKTGLCIGLLEEAAIDGIPAIVIDPKGDLSNLLLTFPQLRPEDFAPWINEDDARKKGLEPAAFAAQQAAMWAKGLAEWDQDGERIARLKAAADFAVYTPGSNAGLPVSVLKSFAAPPAAILDDPELLRDRINGTAMSLLGMMGIAADPIQSREHILLSTILFNAWSSGQDLDIPTLIQRIQQPPFTRLGVMEMETVYPSKERFGLAMALNNLVASPGFGAWLEGEPLDVNAMLHTAAGRPRVSIFSIAHLSDAERMFFVSLLLNQVLGWVRTQSGTTSLRAILYMDEIAGYFPPVANPPSKQPLLTLMKQSRAFGVGIVLATQNPVDLDYKGLANAGTWFIGRLQTERDKQRVLDGLEGAAAGAGGGFDRQAIDGMLSQLGTRVFLMNNVHDDGPVVFESRWAMSYLRGPLTRAQIKTLMDVRRAETRAAASSGAMATASLGAVNMQPRTGPNDSDIATIAKPIVAMAPSTPPPSPPPTAPKIESQPNTQTSRPVLPSEIPQYFLPARPTTAGPFVYKPMLLGIAKVYYSDAKAGVDTDAAASLLASIDNGPVVVDWERADDVPLTESDVKTDPAPGAAFAPLPPDAGKERSYETWKKTFGDALFRRHKLELMRSDAFDLTSKAGESERDFRLRLAQLAREQLDVMKEKLRAKYGPKLDQHQDRVRRAEQAVQVQQQQASSAKIGTALSFGSAILSAFIGRKTISSTSIGRTATAARGVSRSMKESSDVGRAEENLAALRQAQANMQAEFHAELDALTARTDAAAEELERICLKPKKTNVTVRALLLVWAPFAADGSAAWGNQSGRA